MDYYSFFRFMKNIMFNLKCITKYLCYITIFITFIVVCLLLMSCKSYASEQTNGDYTFYVPDEVLSEFQSKSEYNDCYACLFYYQGTWEAYFVPKSDNPDFYFKFYLRTDIGNNAYVSGSSRITNLHYYKPITNSSPSILNYTLGNTNLPKQSNPSAYWFWANCDCYDLNGDITFSATNNSFTAPSFVNYDNTNWGNTLVNGEFNYFYIDGNDCESLIFYFGDITYANTTTDFPVFSVILDSSSPYYYGNNMWAIDKNEPFGVYLNNHTYQLSLQYQRNDTWESVPYRWTTDFSQSVIDDQDQTTMGNIDKGISEMNSFFNDKSFNEQDITNKLPSPPANEDITANGFNNIFDTLRQTFTTNSDLALVFHIPFSDGNITIPANLTENIVPDILKNLIRLVYWYLISRFIVKDIASYIEKAKNGTITEGTDTNIKTDML